MTSADRVTVLEAFPREACLIVPFPPGGSTDLTAHALARGLAEVIGHEVRVETHTGNLGFTALGLLAEREPGSAFVVGTVNTNSIAPIVHPAAVPFMWGGEIAPVTRLADFASVVSAGVRSPEQSLSGLLGRLRQTTGVIRYSTDFLGTNVDVDTIMIGRASDLRVAYRRAPGALAYLDALEAGETDLCILNVATTLRALDRLRPLAVTGTTTRVDALPDVPTLLELGFPEAGTSHWQGLFASRRLDDAAIARVHEVVMRAMATPAGRGDLEGRARIAMSDSPVAFVAEIAREQERWKTARAEILALPELGGEDA